MMTTKAALTRDARELMSRIADAPDAKARLRECRGALDLGSQALAQAGGLSGEEIHQVQAALRLAYRESKGLCRTHVAMAKLARIQMAQEGLSGLPLLQASRTRLTATDTASFALSGGTLLGDWWHGPTALTEINAGRYMLFGTGFDGTFSLSLRLLSGTRRYLDPKEYARIVAVSPDFALDVPDGLLCFGAPGRIDDGVAIDLPRGRYTGVVTCLRGARALRYVATLTQETLPPPALTELVELQGC